jgi:hypothetical protein
MKKKELYKDKKIESVMNKLTNDNLNQIRGGKVHVSGSITVSNEQ